MFSLGMVTKLRTPGRVFTAKSAGIKSVASAFVSLAVEPGKNAINWIGCIRSAENAINWKGCIIGLPRTPSTGKGVL